MLNFSLREACLGLQRGSTLGPQRGLMPRGRFSGMFTYAKQEEKRWCKTHPVALWGKNGMGKWWPQCSAGYRLKEKCEIGK